MTWILYALGALAALGALLFVVGLLLPRTHAATCRILLHQPPEAVWSAITDVEAFPVWRKSLQRVERLPERDGKPAWVEHSRQGRMPIEVVEWSPPRRLVGRIADPSLPFGGTWTHEVAPAPGGCTLTITENGEISNPIFRALARFAFGYHSTIETYQRELAAKFGEPAAPERVL
jgi:uncharacterized protein YndB with AHSA1/START domain